MPPEELSPAQHMQQHPQPKHGGETMGPADGSAESHVLLQGPHVDASRHLETGREPGLCGNSRTCNYKTCAVALGVLVLVLLIAVVVLEVSLSGRFPAVQGPACPDGWVSYQGKCFYFSEGEGNWTYSRSRCSALGASLAGIDTLKEKDFLLRHEGERSYWIGLRRDLGQSWKWANGTEFNNQFEIRGDGDCAYVNKNGISSWRCTSEGH